MSGAVWRQFFSYNKYSQVAARALRQSLNETERVAAEKRGTTTMKFQRWANGQGGAQFTPEQAAAEAKQ